MTLSWSSKSVASNVKVSFAFTVKVPKLRSVTPDKSSPSPSNVKVLVPAPPSSVSIPVTFFTVNVSSPDPVIIFSIDV